MKLIVRLINKFLKNVENNVVFRPREFYFDMEIIRAPYNFFFYKNKEICPWNILW